MGTVASGGRDAVHARRYHVGHGAADWHRTWECAGGRTRGDAQKALPAGAGRACQPRGRAWPPKGGPAEPSWIGCAQGPAPRTVRQAARAPDPAALGSAVAAAAAPAARVVAVAVMTAVSRAALPGAAASLARRCPAPAAVPRPAMPGSRPFPGPPRPGPPPHYPARRPRLPAPRPPPVLPDPPGWPGSSAGTSTPRDHRRRAPPPAPPRHAEDAGHGLGQRPAGPAAARAAGPLPVVAAAAIPAPIRVATAATLTAAAMFLMCFPSAGLLVLGEVMRQACSGVG